jgi:predicted membrane-bound spermidine synthase
MPNLLRQSNARTSSDVNSASNIYYYSAFFIVSGFCALVYEVVWGRLAMASYGVNAALISIVLSVFMAGLGLGSWGAGVLTRRVPSLKAARALRIYSAAELLIGFSSVAVPFELRLGRQFMLHAQGFGTWQTTRFFLLAGFWIALTLIPPCVCMGATFPLLMDVIRKSARSEAKHSFSLLYVSNVLGALLGTILSAFVLIELLGFHGTLYVAASLNASLALLAFALSFTVTSGRNEVVSDSETSHSVQSIGSPRNTILILLFTTGLVSMGMEVVWVRQFTPYLGNAVYAFAEILGIYLLATFLGSRDYRSRVRLNQRNESRMKWSLLALFALLPLLGADPLMPLQGPGATILRLLSIALFCTLTGFLTPSLVDTWSSGNPERAGTAYAINVLGCIIGPLVAGFVLLPWLGERRSIVALSIPLFAIAIVTSFRRKPSAEDNSESLQPKLQLVLAIAGAFAIFYVSHDFETLFPTREVRRDYSATVVALGTGFDRGLLVNGIGMTSLIPITKYMAHLPAAFRSSPPQNGLVICFGMGTSFRSMLSWGIPTTAVDLTPSVPTLFSYFHSDASKLAASHLARIVVDDGRRFLDQSTETYDVIVVDPPPPVEAAGSSLLYSVEFYDVIRKHLRPDGILQIWYPDSIGDATTASSITRALLQSFPYVRAFRSFGGRYGTHYLASMNPILPISSDVLAARLPQAAAADLVEWGPETSPQKQFDLVLSRELSLTRLAALDPGAPAMRDDKPINEYFVLRRYLNLAHWNSGSGNTYTIQPSTSPRTPSGSR